MSARIWSGIVTRGYCPRCGYTATIRNGKHSCGERVK